MSTTKIYIVNVHPMLINESLVWDVFYLRERNSQLYCLRIFNIQLSFMVARLPNLTYEQFEKYINTFIPSNSNIKTQKRTDLADSSYFNFQNNREYIEIYSTNPYDLKKIQQNMEKAFKVFYSRIRENELDANDALFYRNTETPFRFTSTTLTLVNTVYNLSTKYNIPLVGGVQLNESLTTKSFPTDFLPELPNERISGLNAQTSIRWDYKSVNENISKALQRDESIDFKNNMTMFAYDIETYNPDGNLDPNIDEYYIFCIGIGIFDLNCNVPHERFCLISKDFSDTIVNPDTGVKLEYNKTTMFGHKTISVYNEYQNYKVSNNTDDVDIGADEDNEFDDERIIGGQSLTVVNNDTNNSDDQFAKLTNELNKPVDFSQSVNEKSQTIDQFAKLTNEKLLTTSSKIITIEDYNPQYPDVTHYLICKNEKDILNTFIQITMKYRPQIITGFNSFGFDDNYMYTRMVMFGLETEYLQCFTFYDITSDDTLSSRYWFKPFMPEFKQFDLKIDNEPRHDNNSVKAWSVLNVDVYKMMLKEDPKRFTQYGRGNLDTMLEVYDIHNPFNKQPLSKTGLKIHEMYRRWLANENIYSIALYCCQDSWITGTLLISRAKLSDLIEMAGISCTMFSDSIYRADGTRVANAILNYAYNEKFALMDSPYKLRKEFKHDPKTPRLGGKSYDYRTIVGGQVRNIHAGRQWFVVALDYSAMYPSQKEASNIDSSSRIDDDIIKHPEKYNINIVRKLDINDMYGKREVIYVKRQ